MSKSEDDFFGNGKPRVEQAVYFIGKDEQYQVNPIYNLDETPNTPDRFVILKTTANGKFLIGDMIHYSINGWDLITDSDNAIFVDNINKTAFIREYSRALREIAPENPEERQYVILVYDASGEDLNEWVAVMGRTNAYEYIKSHAYTMDVGNSIVITENVPLKDALTVSQFVHYLKNGDIIGDDGFYIEEYEETEFD